MAREGKAARAVAAEALTEAGFVITGRDRRVPGTGVTVSLVADDHHGGRWLFDVCGPHASEGGGLRRTENVWRALGRRDGTSTIRTGAGPTAPLVHPAPSELDVGGIQVVADEASGQVGGGDEGRAASHERVEHRVVDKGVEPDELFGQLHREGGGMPDPPGALGRDRPHVERAGLAPGLVWR